VLVYVRAGKGGVAPFAVLPTTLASHDDGVLQWLMQFLRGSSLPFPCSAAIAVHEVHHSSAHR
jgi:hypothetical protein